MTPLRDANGKPVTEFANHNIVILQHRLGDLHKKQISQNGDGQGAKSMWARNHRDASRNSKR
jgi:hypothetical protein